MAAASTSILPLEPTQRIGYFSISDVIKKFRDFSLYEVIRLNSQVQFLANAKKTCYRLNYANLEFTYAEARDNFSDAIVAPFADAYVKQQMHSISGEQKDLCYYTYSPEELQRFLQVNSSLHYTFLPLTVHATDSANGVRHDMLIIFDNRTKLAYWFDGHNRDDYLPFGRELPKNAIDVLLINFFDKVRLGYNYEPSPSWQMQGTLHAYGSIGLLDFVLSTAWCFIAVIYMEYYDNPFCFVSILDTLSEEDRFNLVYRSMLYLTSAARYHSVVPANTQLDLTAERVPTASASVNPAPSVPVPQPVPSPMRTRTVQETAQPGMQFASRDETKATAPPPQLEPMAVEGGYYNPPPVVDRVPSYGSAGAGTRETDGLIRRRPGTPTAQPGVPATQSLDKKSPQECLVM